MKENGEVVWPVFGCRGHLRGRFVERCPGPLPTIERALENVYFRVKIKCFGAFLAGTVLSNRVGS